MSETNKKEAGVQEETEKDLPETEPVTEPVEESPEATAGTETTEETESAAEDDKESDKETKGKNSFFGKKKKDKLKDSIAQKNGIDILRFETGGEHYDEEKIISEIRKKIVEF